MSPKIQLSELIVPQLRKIINICIVVRSVGSTNP